MIDIDAAISTEWLDELQEAFEYIPVAISRYAHRELRPFASQWVDRTLRQEPGPVQYPIEWESEKQRRAYFASDGFGHGIPYQRSHDYVNAWHVTADYTGGLTSINVRNDLPESDFIGGRRQQRFHKNTGWANAQEELQLLSLALDERIETGLPIVIEQVLDGRYDAL
jgi:hypothetical protein